MVTVLPAVPESDRRATKSARRARGRSSDSVRFDDRTDQPVAQATLDGVRVRDSVRIEHERGEPLQVIRAERVTCRVNQSLRKPGIVSVGRLAGPVCAIDRVEIP